MPLPILLVLPSLLLLFLFRFLGQDLLLLALADAFVLRQDRSGSGNRQDEDD